MSACREIALLRELKLVFSVELLFPVLDRTLFYIMVIVQTPKFNQITTSIFNDGSKSVVTI